MPTVVIQPPRGFGLPDLAAIWRFRELLYFLVWRAVKVRYKQTLIGAAWGIIQPLLNVLVLTVVFGMFVRLPSDGYPYALFVYAAVVPWTYVATSVNAAATSLVDDQALLTKVWFPRLVLPLASVVRPVIDVGLSLVVLLGLAAWHGIAPTWRMLALPLWMLLAIATSLAVGIWLAGLHVRFRDVQHLIPVLVQVWMFASPIAYPVSLVPARWQSWYALNPVAQIVEGFRWSLFGKSSDVFALLPLSVAIVVALLVTGAVVFHRLERSFVDVI
jgi:lipopolysaccharide transport system permease protein